MSIRVKLCDIIEGMESQSDESSSYLNKNTGEVVLIGYEEMSAAEDQKCADKGAEALQEKLLF